MMNLRNKLLKRFTLRYIFLALRAQKTIRMSGDSNGWVKRPFMVILRLCSGLKALFAKSTVSAPSSAKAEPYERASAFTLIEVMIATIIIGISITALFGLQSNLMRSIFSSHEVIQRLVIAKNMFVNADQEKYYESNETKVKKIDKPETTVEYSIDEPSEDIASKTQDIGEQQVQITWPAFFGRNKLTFLSLKFISSAGQKSE